VSDSFATAPRLDSTTLTLRIYPKPPTDHPPSSLQLLLSSSLFYAVSYPLLPLPLVRSHPTSTNQPTTPVPRVPRLPACLPACGACFPIPHSTIVVVVARTLREKVTSRSRVSQDPANPSWYKIAPSGSQYRRRRLRGSRRNAPERETSGNWDSVWIGTIRYRRLRGMIVVDGHCAITQRRSTNASRVDESPIVEARQKR